MEDNPVKIERRDGKIQGLFITEEWRDMDENKARNYYNVLCDEINVMESKIEKMYKDIGKFGDIFSELPQEETIEEIIEETNEEIESEESEDLEDKEFNPNN